MTVNTLVTEEKIKSLKTWDEVVDYIEEMMVKQNEQCEEDDSCMIRKVEDGKTTCCAYGAIVPDSFLDKIDVFGGIITSFLSCPELKEFFKNNIPFILEDENLDWLHSLQTSHDAYEEKSGKEFGEYFREEVAELKKQWGMDKPENRTE